MLHPEELALLGCISRHKRNGPAPPPFTSSFRAAYENLSSRGLIEYSREAGRWILTADGDRLFRDLSGAPDVPMPLTPDEIEHLWQLIRVHIPYTKDEFVAWLQDPANDGGIKIEVRARRVQVTTPSAHISMQRFF